MKDYFNLVNAAHRKYPSMDGWNHAMAVSVIQVVSCQICVRMLDFKFHTAIVEMFHLFFDRIQLSHPQEIFSSIEHIMTLINQNPDESDEFVVELTKMFLAALNSPDTIVPVNIEGAHKIWNGKSRKPNSFIKPEEGYDPSWMFSESASYEGALTTGKVAGIMLAFGRNNSISNSSQVLCEGTNEC